MQRTHTSASRANARACAAKGTETRPIGIPTFEDKVLQRAIVMLLESIYEQNFHDGSYGFRPKRSAHDAMDSLWKETMRISGGWILEVDFRHPSHSDRKRDGHSKPDTFDLLGFTHYWGKSRKGNWTVKKKTMSGRLTRAVRSIYQWCRVYRHLPVREQWKKLCQKARGHYAYYGATGNGRMLNNFRHEARRVWRKWLNRRNRERKMTWAKFERFEKRYPLPLPKIYHSGQT